MSSSILKQLRCDLGLQHKISKDAENELYSTMKKIDTQCLRCNAWVTLEIDPKDKNYYIVIEK